MRNDYNWENKYERAEQAKKHTQFMEESYKPEIIHCIETSEIFRVSNQKPKLGKPTVEIINCDSVSALFNPNCYKDENCAVLNFASYKYPGGGFLAGSRAQEECLCHESWLFNVLKEFDANYYEENRHFLNGGLYYDAAIYTPKVRFEHDNKVKYADVITCAAPNKGTALKYGHADEAECSRVLWNRIDFITNILTHKDLHTVILGAYGCGVFKQDPEEVATFFKQAIRKLGEMHVIFAIPESNRDDNYQTFKRIFADWDQI